MCDIVSFNADDRVASWSPHAREQVPMSISANDTTAFSSDPLINRISQRGAMVNEE